MSPQTTDAKKKLHMHYVGVCRITYYYATGNAMATGIYPYYGAVAVDPSVIPLWSHVVIKGVGLFRALDTGGGVWGCHIDVFLPSWRPIPDYAPVYYY